MTNRERLTANGTKLIADPIQNIQGFKLLSLKLQGSIASIVRGISSIPCVTELHIEPLSDDTENIDHEGLLSAFQRLKSLWSLIISINFNSRLTEDGFTCLIDKVKESPALSSLEVQIFHCKNMKDNSFKALAQLFTSYKLLIKLDIMFLAINFTDNGMLSLAHSLGFLTQLTNFSFSVSESKVVSDEAMAQVFNGLSKLERLVHLELNFWECPKVGDATISSIENLLRSCPSITFFDLTQDDQCKGLTDDGLNALASGLSTYTNFTHFRINLLADQTSEAAALNIIDALVLQEKLRLCHLNLKGSKVTDMMVNKLTEYLRVQEEVKDIYFTLDWSGVSQEAKESLNGIGKLRKFKRFII
eukprot:TRINITY_DN5800_c0_g2_i1.p1 TRINITY_DN5800_c0_g2~~TRINITY_DN5800_c0_g2_i1.p1  ORF type:complete len:360 (-),score=40.07 TRINITY_DN5800_c0_g2_i1:119-1198(-)